MSVSNNCLICEDGGHLIPTREHGVEAGWWVCMECGSEFARMLVEDRLQGRLQVKADLLVPVLPKKKLRNGGTQGNL